MYVRYTGYTTTQHEIAADQASPNVVVTIVPVFIDFPDARVYDTISVVRASLISFSFPTSSLRETQKNIAGQAVVEVHGGGDDAGAVHPQGRGVAARAQDGLGRPRGRRGPPPQEQSLQAQRELRFGPVLPVVRRRVDFLF